MKRLFLLFILILMPLSLAFSLSAPSIYFASDEALRNMCALRGIEEGTREEMQNALYEYEGLEAYSIEEPAADSESEESEGIQEQDEPYVLTIDSAENLSRDGDRAILSGGSSISFLNNGIAATLSADTIVIDMDNSRLTALENVSYHTDDESAAIQDINADIVTLAWESGGIVVTDATTSTTKEPTDDNPDPITIYTSGETLRFSQDGGMIYQDGFITSNPDEAYSSITAKEIAMLPGSDMFVTNAYLSIGRVPIFWLPFLYFPGSQVVGNPAIGFSSTKGAFLNTTFELLGRAESVNESDDGNSFMSLFSSGENRENNQPHGAYYSSDEPLSPAEQWARSSESYIALMADAYADTGLHLGVDSRLNFFEDSLNLSALDGVGVSKESNYYEGRFRYYGVNELSYNNYGVDLTLSVPFYSDSRVMRDFGNRLTGFSLFSLLETPEFPEDYSSTISSFSDEIVLDYSLPSEHRSDLVSSFSISDLTVGADQRWDSSAHKFYVNEVSAPSFTASVSGTLFNLAASRSPVVVAEKKEYDETEIHLLSDPLLYSIYKAEEKRQEATGDENYKLSLAYSLSENLENQYQFDRDGKNTDSTFSSSTSMRLTLEAAAADYASLKAVFTPSYSYLWDDKDSITAYTHRGTVNSDVTFAVPLVGIEYRIASRLFNYRGEYEDGVLVTDPDEVMHKPGWNDDTITAHTISLTKAFTTEVGTFTPSVSYVLPPLAAELTPRLSYGYGPFAVSFGWDFLQEDTESPFRSDLVEFSFGYNGTYLTSSLSLRYQTADYDSSDFWIPFYGEASLSLRTEDKRWSITQYVDYAYYDGGRYNYFDSIKTTLKIPYFDLSLEWQGEVGNVKFRSIEAHLDVDSAFFQLWKGRLYFAFGIDSDFEMDMQNPYAAMFTITPSITFSIAEFLDFRFSFSSSNNAFYQYIQSGNFFGELFSDLANSFDFIGDGRYNTNFVMSNATLEVIHYMDDWDLHCSYSAKVVLSDDVYEFVPEFSIYLSWKTIPDLKVDQNWKYNANTRKWER